MQKLRIPKKADCRKETERLQKCAFVANNLDIVLAYIANKWGKDEKFVIQFIADWAIPSGLDITEAIVLQMECYWMEDFLKMQRLYGRKGK